MKKHFFTSIVFLFTTLSLTVCTSCSKDDDDINEGSSPGYFLIDGLKYNLDIAAFEYSDPQTDHRQYSVSFCTENLKEITSEDDFSKLKGKYSFCLFQCMDPKKENTIPIVGEYKYQPDNLAPKSFTYFDFSFYHVDTEKSISLEYILGSNVTITKTGNVYEFSSKGTTDDGKSYEFYYKGSIIPLWWEM